MWISPASAAHFAPPSETSGGAIMLSIILGVVVLFFFLRIGLKKLRQGKSGSDGH
jgi:hypothetical protein